MPSTKITPYDAVVPVHAVALDINDLVEDQTGQRFGRLMAEGLTRLVLLA